MFLDHFFCFRLRSERNEENIGFRMPYFFIIILFFLRTYMCRIFRIEPPEQKFYPVSFFNQKRPIVSVLSRKRTCFDFLDILFSDLRVKTPKIRVKTSKSTAHPILRKLNLVFLLQHIQNINQRTMNYSPIIY